MLSKSIIQVISHLPGSLSVSHFVFLEAKNSQKKIKPFSNSSWYSDLGVIYYVDDTVHFCFVAASACHFQNENKSIKVHISCTK